MCASVQSAAAAIEKLCPNGIDVLVNNAVSGRYLSFHAHKGYVNA